MLRTTARTILFAMILAADAGPGRAADLGPADRGGGPPAGRFLATCEDLGQFCRAETCGRDQIDAALGCRAACPSGVVLSVVPARCPLPSVRVTLRRKG
ncbi:hypothetical protein [Methylobacterium sp. A54F]